MACVFVYVLCFLVLVSLKLLKSQYVCVLLFVLLYPQVFRQREGGGRDVVVYDTSSVWFICRDLWHTCTSACCI